MSAWDKPIESSKKSFTKTQWYIWSSGYNYMRIISEPHIVDTHYIMNSTVKCLGRDECPVCKDNKNLWIEFGKEAKNHGLVSTSTRVFFNVLDRTVGKVCPNADCGVEVKKVRGSFPSSCPKCNTLLTNVEAKKLNLPRVVQISSNVFNDLILKIRSEVQDGNGNPLPLTAYDIVFNSVGEGKERRSAPEVPEVINTEEVAFDSEKLADLSTCYLNFTASEILSLRQGVTVKDIFAARKGTSVVVKDPEVDNEVNRESIKNRIASLLTQDEE